MADDIPRIEVENIAQTKRKRKFFCCRCSKKKLAAFGVGAIILIILAFFAVFLPAKRVYGDALSTLESAKEAYQAVKNQDITKVGEILTTTHEKLIKTQKSYQALSFLRFIPFFGNYWRDGDHLLKAGLAGIEAGQISVEAIVPYADLLGLKGKSTFVSKSTDERIQTAVSTLDKLTPKFGEISQKLEIVKKETEFIDPNRYPAQFGKLTPRSQIFQFKSLTTDLSGLFISARPLLEISPDLLGQREPRRYLVLFQNDKELRPTGGFITAYAIFKIDKGKMKVELADDIYKLDERNTTNIFPPKPFIDHLKVYRLYIRDSNFEPDFVASMQKFEEIYKKINGQIDFDGVIAVDTDVLVEAVKILGPIPAYGTNFTAEPDKRCDGCPNIIYELEEYAGQRVSHLRENRKDIIGVLLYQIMQKALGVSPGQYWGQLSQMFLREISEKHILVYLHEEKAQKGVESFNMAGRIKDFSGDYLHVNDANLGGAKSNMFISQSLKQEYEIKSDGSIVKTLTITYKNSAPSSSGCNLEAGGLCLNGPMPNWLRIYVPFGSKLLGFKGSEDKEVVSEAYGKTVFEGFLVIRPLGTAQVIVRYQLPFKAEKGEGLKLLIQKQPGTEGHPSSIFINGQKTAEFPLETDKEIDLKF